jgi:hypothetical protein
VRNGTSIPTAASRPRPAPPLHADRSRGTPGAEWRFHSGLRSRWGTSHLRTGPCAGDGAEWNLHSARFVRPGGAMRPDRGVGGGPPAHGMERPFRSALEEAVVRRRHERGPRTKEAWSGMEGALAGRDRARGRSSPASASVRCRSGPVSPARAAPGLPGAARIIRIDAVGSHEDDPESRPPGRRGQGAPAQVFRRACGRPSRREWTRQQAYRRTCPTHASLHRLPARCRLCPCRAASTPRAPAVRTGTT